MSDAENIALWKKKAEIDYIPLFVSLWLSLDAWLRDRYTPTSDRSKLELFKRNIHKISDDFYNLLYNENAEATAFKGNIAELHKALLNANIRYEQNDNMKKEVISFSSIKRKNDRNEFEFTSILKDKSQQNKVKIVEELYFDDDKEKIFSGFIEIVYQIRCKLFHGDLKPTPENERVIKYIYLTTYEIMKRV